MREWIEMASEGIQALAVVIIVVSIIFGFARYVLQLARRSAQPYSAYKRLLGRSLMLALEILVAADVIRTVLLDLTAKGLEILAALVAVRTFLSWSLVVELEGHWPWQSACSASGSERSRGDRAGSVLGEVKEPDFEDPIGVVTGDSADLSNANANGSEL